MDYKTSEGVNIYVKDPASPVAKIFAGVFGAPSASSELADLEVMTSMRELVAQAREHAEVVSELICALENTARWRAEKAAEFPNDRRNRSASEACERLSRLTNLSDEAAGRYYDAFHGDDHGYAATERQSEVLRGIGFHSDYETLDALVDAIVPVAA